MTTMERIDKLSSERSRLYRSTHTSRRDAPKLKQRIAKITGELDQLWELRRRERIGRLDGIDLIVDQAYTHTYGKGYRDAVAPAAVEEEQDAMELVA
jgi:hypothetical protein